MKYFLFSFLLITSIQAGIEDKLMGSHNIKIIKEDVLNRKEILRPYGLWVKLIEFYGKRNYCLWYKTPFKEDLGELKLMVKKAGLCDEKDISWYQGKVRSLNVNVQDSKIDLNYEVLDEKYHQKIFLVNLLNQKAYELFDPPVKKKYLSGLHLLD